MIDSKTSFYINLRERATTPILFTHPIVGMKMEGYPDPTLKQITYHDGKKEITTDFNRETMVITESPKNETIIKIRILQQNGAILISQNRQMNDIEFLGIIEIGKSQYIKLMFDNANRQQMAKN